MEFVFFPPTIVICFFILYIHAKHDFVMLRQSISLSQVFDAFLIACVSAFLMGRSIFMVNSLSSDLLSIFRFFHIFKYPGISLLGAYIGAALSLYLIFMKKKGVLRMGDIFVISFFPLFSINLFFENYRSVFFFLPFVLFVLSIAFFIFFLSSHNKYILRDGSIAIIFAMLLFSETFLSDFFSLNASVLLSLSLLQIFSGFGILFALIALYLNQRKKT